MRKVFSFSNVVAVLALFLALGGSVYAASNKISGTQIKPRSLPGNRIKARSLTGTQIKPGSLKGKQIVGSSLTGVSAASLASVQYSVTTVTLARGASSGTSTTAGCPPGLKVIGGGAIVSNDLLASVNDSGPEVSRTGWEATARTGSDGVTMTVTAICTAVTSTAGLDRQERDSSPPPPLYYRP